MNADILRLILFIAGVALILGIYFWDRHKRVNARVHAIKKAQFESDSQITMSDPELPPEPEVELPYSQPVVDEIPSDSAMDEALDELDQMVWADSQLNDDPIEGQGEFSFTADDPADSPFGADSSDFPVLILQLNVVSTGGGFAGNGILRVARELELEYGDMNVFHRYAGGNKKGPVVFSMASMVEPGVFPLKEMASFSTPGVTLFCQLPGPKDGLAVFSDMLFTAERIAALLQGELQDETHSVLSKQTIEHLRERVLEHARQVQLIRSKKARH